MPAILCECGFMDYKADALLMKDDDFQTEVAEEICQGLCVYFKVKYISPDIIEEDIDCTQENKKLKETIKEQDLLLQVTTGKLSVAERNLESNREMVRSLTELNSSKHLLYKGVREGLVDIVQELTDNNI